MLQGTSLLAFRTQFIVAGPGLLPWNYDQQFLAGMSDYLGAASEVGNLTVRNWAEVNVGNFPVRPWLYYLFAYHADQQIPACLLAKTGSGLFTLCMLAA